MVWVLINITCAYFGYIVENKAEKQHHTLSRSASFSSHTSCLAVLLLSNRKKKLFFMILNDISSW